MAATFILTTRYTSLYCRLKVWKKWPGAIHSACLRILLASKQALLVSQLASLFLVAAYHRGCCCSRHSQAWCPCRPAHILWHGPRDTQRGGQERQREIFAGGSACHQACSQLCATRAGLHTMLCSGAHTQLCTSVRCVRLSRHKGE